MGMVRRTVRGFLNSLRREADRYTRQGISSCAFLKKSRKVSLLKAVTARPGSGD